MRLKRIEIQGFKTFATRTTLDIGPGITGIVGPNGSGKSNLADAVRWVLGEQSMRSVRCRRTEDIIFAGGSRRPPSGLAEVSITLDNSSGRLNLPYAEVSITRRAYRSGDTEYLLNRERLRLREVTNLLGRAGLQAGAYTIVGQGLVDRALSLRPTERRELLEEAAAISHYRAQMEESRERLAQTQQNLARVRDVLAEIEPRLHLLEKQADQARQAEQVSNQLAALQITWYGQRWRASIEQTRQMTALVSQLSTTADRWRDRQLELAALSVTTNERRASLNARLHRARKELADLQGQRESGFRERAIAEERRRNTLHRLEEARDEVTRQEESRRAELEALAETRAAWASAEAYLARLKRELTSAEEATSGIEKRRSELQLKIQKAQQACAVTATSLANLEGEFRALTEFRQAALGRLSVLDSGRGAIEQKAEQARRRLTQAEESITVLAAQEEAIAHARDEAERSFTSLRERQRGLERELGDSQRETQALTARLEALSDWQAQQTGYYPGVRAVLRSARGHSTNSADSSALRGVVGIVAELIRSPRELELAIEVALGGRYQDVVVERWSDAEAAVQFLKQSNAGRATFLPLDTLRASRSRTAPDGPGIIGVATRLVSYQPRYQMVLQHLLGNTLIVEDLPTARRVLRQIGTGWQIVTPGGDLVRSSGAITGGASSISSKGVLARQRELRTLPRTIAQMRSEQETMRADLQSARAAEQALQESLTELRRREEKIKVDRRQHNGELSVSQRELATVEEERRLHQNEYDRLSIEISEAMARAVSLEESIRAARATERMEMAELERLKHELSQGDVADGAAIAHLGELRAARAAAEREQQMLAREITRNEASLVRTAEHLAERAARVQQLIEEIERQDAMTETAAAMLGQVESQLGEARGIAEEIEREIAAAAEDQASLQREEDQARLELRAAQDAWHQAERDLTSSLANCEVLRRQVAADIAPAEQVDGTLRVQLNGQWVTLGESDEPVDGLEQSIGELKARLRSLGGRGRSTIEEYEQTLARHSFLSEQLSDLEAAAGKLRRVIDELDTTIHQQFEETFRHVATMFKRNFSTLFGGGTARLILTQSDDSEPPGIDILAQPPGRRSQGLAQLSGGERSLTAVALLFAIIEANPLPFCVLDEVDAALDDANIDRFGDLLVRLSAQTQFLIITHNRRTMEVATALHGLSIEDGSISRVFSLQLASG